MPETLFTRTFALIIVAKLRDNVNWNFAIVTRLIFVTSCEISVGNRLNLFEVKLS